MTYPTCTETVTKPKWVHDCIERYVAEGIDREEAEQRCYGAYQRRGKSRIQPLDDEFMAIITTNSYQDRDGEWITTKALQDHVERQWDGNQYIGKDMVLFWHADVSQGGVHIGRVVWTDMQGPFMIEVAQKRRSGVPAFQRYIDKVWNGVRRTPGRWGASPGFKTIGKDLDDTYHQFFKFETTIAPRFITANVLTASEVIT